MQLLTQPVISGGQRRIGASAQNRHQILASSEATIRRSRLETLVQGQVIAAASENEPPPWWIAMMNGWDEQDRNQEERMLMFMSAQAMNFTLKR